MALPIRLDILNVKVRSWDRVGDVVARCGGTLRSTIPELRWAEVSIDDAQAADTIRAYEADPDVEEVHFAHELTRKSQPYNAATNDSMLQFQDALDVMNVPAAWAETKGDPGVFLGILDSGIVSDYASLPEFAGKTIVFFDMRDNGQPASDSDQNHHGTSVASVVAGNCDKGSGPVGVAPNCSLIIARMNGSNDVPACAGLIKLSDLGAKLLNLSWGWDDPSDPVDGMAMGATSLYIDTFTLLKARGALVWFAACNSGYNSDRSGVYGEPAALGALHGFFSVAAVTGTAGAGRDRLVRYSNTGKYCNVAAPGHRAWSGHRDFWPTSVNVPAGWVSPWGDAVATGAREVTYTWEMFNGTSCASPLAMAVAGFGPSVNPGLDGDALRDIYLASLDRSEDPDFYSWMPAAAGVPDALKVVRLSKALGDPGVVYPFVRFRGRGVERVYAGGAASTYLRGAVNAEVTGFAYDEAGVPIPVTRVQLIAKDPGTGVEDVIYDGAPRTTWDSLLPTSSAWFVGKNVKVVAYTESTSGFVEYTTFVAEAASATPPKTTADPRGGARYTGSITLSVRGENPPFTTRYRWNGGAWQTYAAPFPSIEDGVLEFYSVDALGNDESAGAGA